MGFDIEICSLENLRKGDSIASTYISYNFGVLSDICVKHYISGECQCEKTHLWYFRDDCHRRCGKDVAERAKRALDFLGDINIFPGDPDLQNPSWGWASKCNAKQKLEVFAYHINRFMELGKEYPNYFFFGDADDNDDIPILPDNYTPNDDAEVRVSPAVTYFRHPFKGNIAIRTFKDAIEIYGLCKALNDSRAEGWYNLAFEMPDAPQHF